MLDADRSVRTSTMEKIAQALQVDPSLFDAYVCAKLTDLGMKNAELITAGRTLLQLQRGQRSARQ